MSFLFKPPRIRDNLWQPTQRTCGRGKQWMGSEADMGGDTHCLPDMLPSLSKAAGKA